MILTWKNTHMLKTCIILRLFYVLFFVLIPQNQCSIFGQSFPKSNTMQRHYDDEPESGLCSVSKVSFSKSSYTYTWEVKSLLQYLDYVEEFEQSFTHEAKDVNFDSSERMNGTWNFKIQALKRQSEPQLQTHVYSEYKYLQTEANLKMNIGIDIQFRLSPDLRNYNISSPAPGFTFSIRKPSRTVVEKTMPKFKRKPPVSISLVTPAEVKSKPKKGEVKERTRIGILPANWFSTDPDSSEEKDFFGPNDEDSGDKVEDLGIASMTFDSPNIQSQLVAIRNILKTEAGADATDVQLVFRIFVFFPNEVLPVQSASCRRWDNRIVEQLPIPNEAIQLNTEIPLPTVPKNENIKTSGECSVESTVPSFTRNLESMFLNRTYSDLIIRVQNHDFPVHRVILAYSSSILESLLTGNLSILEVDGLHVSVTGMEETLRFIYTGKLKSSLTTETAADTLRLAYKFGIERLKKLCENFLLAQISVDNVIQLYSLSKDVFLPALAKAAIDFIKRNKQVVISQSEEFHSLTTKYPMLMFELFMSS